MSVQVHIPTPLRSLTGGAAAVTIDAQDVASLIEALESRHAGIRERLVEPDGSLRRFVRIFVNEEDIRFLADAKTPLKAGDSVAIES